jgi:hypothetical protein
MVVGEKIKILIKMMRGKHMKKKGEISMQALWG